MRSVGGGDDDDGAHHKIAADAHRIQAAAECSPCRGVAADIQPARRPSKTRANIPNANETVGVGAHERSTRNGGERVDLSRRRARRGGRLNVGMRGEARMRETTNRRCRGAALDVCQPKVAVSAAHDDRRGAAAAAAAAAVELLEHVDNRRVASKRQLRGFVDGLRCRVFCRQLWPRKNAEASIGSARDEQIADRFQRHKERRANALSSDRATQQVDGEKTQLIVDDHDLVP